MITPAPSSTCLSVKNCFFSKAIISQNSDKKSQVKKRLVIKETYNMMVLSKQTSVSVRSTITMSVSKISPPSCRRQNTAHRWSSTEAAEWAKNAIISATLIKSQGCRVLREAGPQHWFMVRSLTHTLSHTHTNCPCLIILCESSDK